MEKALIPIAKLQDHVRDTRRARDAVGPTWELTFAALKYAARAAASGATRRSSTATGSVRLRSFGFVPAGSTRRRTPLSAWR